MDTAKRISMSCHRAAGLGMAEAGDHDVDLNGERRRALDACKLRYRTYFGTEMISM